MKKLQKRIKDAFGVYREKGLQGLNLHAQKKIINRREARKYQKWLEKHGKLTDERRAEIKSEIETFSIKPLISVVMPVYDVDEKWLRLCVESVIGQIYENWEFCIADDASPSAHIKKVLEEYADADARIKLVFRTENGHISAASNSALDLAAGEFTALLDHDDELSEDALFYVVKEINDFPDAQMIYSDEDLIDEHGRRFSPKFKPDFSRDLMYSLNLITHLSVYKTSLLRKINGFRKGAEGSQDYDLALRVFEEIDEKQIRHIPRILYHWRVIRGSVAYSLDEKPYAHERAREAIRAHLVRSEKTATVSPAILNLHRVRYELPEKAPKVSLILSGGEKFRQSKEFFERETVYENLEIIESKAETAESLNCAAAPSNGDILCFVNSGLKPKTTDWLAEMISFAVQPEIGAVGAKISDQNEMVLHGGLVIGTSETVSAAHRGFPSFADGNLLRLQVTGNFSAVSISCFCIRKSLFETFDGFDAENLPNRFFDADLCLKLREKRLRIVFTPYAEMIRNDNAAPLNLEIEPREEEKIYFLTKWQKVCARDPFYNPNLSKKDGNFSTNI